MMNGIEFGEVKDEKQMKLLERKLQHLRFIGRMAEVTGVPIKASIRVERDDHLEYILRRIYSPLEDEDVIKYVIIEEFHDTTILKKGTTGEYETIHEPIILNFILTPKPSGKKEPEEDEDEDSDKPKPRGKK